MVTRDDWDERASEELGTKVRLTLGTPGASELLFADAHGRCWTMGTRLEPTPLRASWRIPSSFGDTSVFGEVVPELGRCRSRRLHFADKHVFWASLEFPGALYFVGSAYFAGRQQAETILELVIRYEDESWVDRLQSMFTSMIPEASREPRPDPFFDRDRGLVYFYSYDCAGLERGALGVRDTTLLWTRKAGLLRRQVAEGHPTAEATELEAFSTSGDARAAFETREHALFEDGCCLGRVVAVPIEGPPATRTAERVRSDSPSPPLPLMAVAPSVAEHLEAAGSDLATGRTESAFARLRTAWETRPMIEVARAIDVLSRRVRLPHAIGGSSAKSRAAWEAAWAEQPESARLLLLDAVDGATKKVRLERIERVLELRPDPRCEAALVRWFRTDGYGKRGNERLLGKVLRRLEGMRDARQADALAALPAFLRSRRTDDAGRALAHELEALSIRLAARLGALEALRPTPDEAELLDSVVEHGS